MVYGREAVYGNVEAAATPALAPIAAGYAAAERGQQSSTAPLLRELSGLRSGGTGHRGSSGGWGGVCGHQRRGRLAGVMSPV